MEKVESVEIKEYLINFVSEKLEKCKLFVKVFGKNFAKNSLKKNLIAVYTNEFDENMAAYYSSTDKCITFCTNKENSKILTVTYIQKSKKMQAIMLHEAIHAILNRSQSSCKAAGLIYATGITEVEKQGIEYGRGLNEGLTNWICEKTGIDRDTYTEETNFIKQLELALGPTTIMEMAKGRIKRNVSKQLNMAVNECYAFLRLVDEIYYTKLRLSKYLNIEESLNKTTAETKSNQEKLIALHQELENIMLSNSTHTQYCVSYFDYMIEKGFSAKNELEFVRYIIAQEKDRLTKLIAEVESKIFDKYFKKDLETISSSGNISQKDYEKYLELKSLMATDAKNKELMQYSSFEFLQNFDKIFKGTYQNKAKQFRELYKVVLPSRSSQKTSAKKTEPSQQIR